MRYEHGFVVQVPFLDTNADGSVSRNYALVSSNDNVDRRRVRRILRQWVKSYLFRQLSTREQRSLMTIVKKHTEPMMYFVQHKTEALNETPDTQGVTDSQASPAS